MKNPKSKKIQVLLSGEVAHKLNQIITTSSLVDGKLKSASGYVRDLILSHIKEYEGEQVSFVNQKVQRIMNELKNQNKDE